MKLFGAQLQVLIASVARGNCLIPRTNEEADRLLRAFLKGEKLPIKFAPEPGMIKNTSSYLSTLSGNLSLNPFKSKTEVVDKPVDQQQEPQPTLEQIPQEPLTQKKPEHPTSEYFAAHEIEMINEKEQTTNANLSSFNMLSLLNVSTIARCVKYIAFGENAALDSRVFLCNRDNQLIQDIFNLAEVKLVRQLRSVTLESCKSKYKFYLPPNVFKDALTLRRFSPVTLEATPPQVTLKQSEIVNYDLFEENPVYLMIRLMVDHPLPGFSFMHDKIRTARAQKIKQEQANQGRGGKSMNFIPVPEMPEIGKKVLGAASGFFMGLMGKKRSNSTDENEHTLATQNRKVDEAHHGTNYPSQPTPGNMDDEDQPELKPKINPSDFLLNGSKPNFMIEEEQVSVLQDTFEQDLPKNSTPKTSYRGTIPREIKLSEEMNDNLTKSFSSGWTQSIDESNVFEKIIVHIHGGGFMAMTSSSHQVYLRKWAKYLKIPVFSIEYRLAPQSQFPFVLNDCIRAYLWILTFLERIVLTKVKQIILAGDSAGGNLALALCAWCIENGIRKPDMLHLHYPAASLNRFSFTPSFMYSVDDYLLSFGVLKASIEAYVPEYVDASQNPYVSPLLFPPEILVNFPKTEVFVCERDPLRDDGLRLVLKLLKVGVRCKIVYFKYVSHGILNLCMRFGLPEAQAFELKIRESLEGHLKGKFTW
jgi:acetyl esterase/lipase